MRIFLLLTLITHIFTQVLYYNFIPLDRFDNQLYVAGAQPYGILLQAEVDGATLAAGTAITFSSSSNYAFFRVPAGAWTEQVVILSDGSGTGQDCLATYTTGTPNTMVWTLGTLNGACKLADGSVWQFVVPADFAQINPPLGVYDITVTVSGGGKTTYSYFYNSYAVIYVTVDPRNADNSASYLVGAGQPSFLNIGFTTTWNVAAGAVIQLDASASVFLLPGLNSYAIPIAGTGCTAALTSSGIGPTSSLSFALSGAACLIARNVAVDGGQFTLPGALLGVHPVSTKITVTVRITVGSMTYSVRNGNPGAYTTTDGCNPWSAWSSCSATCGSGFTYHTRTANAVCGSGYESRVCNTVACGCAPWGAWGACSATCGGTVSRYRTGSSGCNVATADTQPCGPTDCGCPWTQTACSSRCGSGVHTRTVTPANPNTICGALEYTTVCDEPFTNESLACPCQDIPWQDRFGSTCADYVTRQWCTSTGGYGPGWNFSAPGFRSFDYRTNNGNNALSACCGCGKSRCMKDTILLVDQSGSISQLDWEKTHKYIWDRVNQTKFTDEYGNRVAVLQFDAAASILCPLTWDRTFLLNCIAGITFPAGPGTATSAGLDLAYAVFDRHSSPNRTRVIELLTDGSPNVPGPDSAAIQAAVNSAYTLKDTGVTILTIGMGLACASSTSSDCLNQDVLNALASEPASSYAVLLSTYDSLTAVSLFISSQCQAKFAGFDPSPSPLPQYSPDPSTSPSPSASPNASASQSPRVSASVSLSPGASPTASPAGSPSPWASASPSPSVSVSLSPWPSRSPWPSASPPISPLPSQSPDANALCQAKQALIPSVGWLKQDLWGCDEAAVAYLLLQYQCVQLEPKCPSFQCTLPVPPSVVLQIQSTCNSVKP